MSTDELFRAQQQRLSRALQVYVGQISVDPNAVAVETFMAAQNLDEEIRELCRAARLVEDPRVIDG
jgi:hypothetical protein